MLPEYYDRFKTEYKDAVGRLENEFAQLRSDAGQNDVSTEELAGIFAGFQQDVIDVCTGFEETWLAVPNKITHAFENICEELYAFSSGDNEAAYRIDAELETMPGMFEECYERSERKLSIALIARNESRYLREWIEYNRLMGASYFYVYDHESTDDSGQIYDEYVKKGIMELNPVSGEYLPTQIACYNDALTKARYHTRYIAFIDTDEFLVPIRHESVTEAIDSIIASYDDTPFKSPGSCRAGGIGVNWRVYGSSGHETPVDGLVIEEFTRRGPDELMVNAHIKTICDPLAVKNIINPHFAIYEQGYWCISEHGSLIPGAFFYDSKGDILRLNHYYVKSEQEYRERRLNFKRSEAGRQRLQTEEEVKRANEVYDNIMDRFVPALKDRLGMN